MFELWGDSPPSTANNMVSIYVHRLRKEVLGDSEGKVLVHRAPGYLLRVSPGDVDFQVFESLAAKGGRAGSGRPGAGRRAAGEALGLWRGPLLADVQPSPLIEAHADQAAELLLDTTELRVEADLACGRAAQVISGLRGLVAEHPLRERLWALLMRALRRPAGGPRRLRRTHRRVRSFRMSLVWIRAASLSVCMRTCLPRTRRPRQAGPRAGRARRRRATDGAGVAR